MAVGSALIDSWAQVTDDFLREHVQGKKGGSIHCDPKTLDRVMEAAGPLKTGLGGSAGNTVRAMAKLGIPSLFTSLVGNDPSGDRYCEEMKAMGISGIVRDPDFTTVRILALVTPDGERTFLHSHQCSDWNFDLDPDHFRKADWIHFESFLLWEAPQFLEKSLKLAHEEGITISLDLSNFLVVQQYKKKLFEWIERYVDVLFGNEEEIRALTGLSIREGCMELQNLCPIVVVMKGSDGCLIGCHGELTHVPGFPTKVMDTTAAGDYFTAGFIYGYLQQFPLSICARIGNRLGSSIIETFGTELPMEKWKEIHSHLKTENSQSL